MSTLPAAQDFAAVACRRHEDGQWHDFEDTIAREVQIRVKWPGREPLSLWAHPTNLEELARGHALVELCTYGVAPRIESATELEFALAPQPSTPLPDAPAPQMQATDIHERMEGFIKAGGKWEATGCFHRMGVYCPRRNDFIDMVEDIGRHNCIDRIAARMLARQENPSGLVLFISARATASLVDKITRAGFCVAISRAAVTTAGLDMAVGRSLTLAGFARPGRFTVFNNPDGLILDPEPLRKED